jgi:hypothetical protein
LPKATGSTLPPIVADFLTLREAPLWSVRRRWTFWLSKGLCELTVVVPGKERLLSIVSMLVGLIKANSDYRLHDAD